jgi:hypothetical protein
VKPVIKNGEGTRPPRPAGEAVRVPPHREVRFAHMWIGALALAAAAALLVYSSARVAQRGRFAAPYSTFGGGPDGARALLLLARELGHDARPFTRELTHLPRGTLVVLAGCKGALLRKLARPEREALAAWVEAGGLLIVAGDPAFVPEAAGLGVARKASCGESTQRSALERLLAPHTEGESDAIDAMPERVEAHAAGAPLTHLLSFEVPHALGLRIAHDSEATEILTSAEGMLGLTAAFGRGRFVLLGIPDALTNGTVSDGGGLVFARLLAAFAPPGPVLFDEYHLGMGERRSLIGYLRDAGYAPLLGQLLIASLAFMLAGAVRLAPARPALSGGAPHSVSFLDALSGLYANTGDAPGALQRLSRAALQNVARHYHAEHVTPERLASWLAARGLHAAAAYARRITEHGREPLRMGERLTARAAAIAEDERAALAMAELA